MFNRIHHLLIGPPLPTMRLAAEKLNKVRALAAFSPDALSSIAYANQEIYLGLVLAGSAGLGLALPIGLAIVAVLVLVAISYFQTIHGYPSGGGSCVVARENSGAPPGLIAEAALRIGYVLTAALGLSAGVPAIALASPDLWPSRAPFCLALWLIGGPPNSSGLGLTGVMVGAPIGLHLVRRVPRLVAGAPGASCRRPRVSAHSVAAAMTHLVGSAHHPLGEPGRITAVTGLHSGGAIRWRHQVSLASQQVTGPRRMVLMRTGVRS